MTAPRSLRELFDQLGLHEVRSDEEGVFVMEMPVDERTRNTAGGLQGGLIAVALGQVGLFAGITLYRVWKESP